MRARLAFVVTLLGSACDDTGSWTRNYGRLDVLAGALGGPGHADGIGAAARFDFPMGMALDGDEALLIADSGSGRIRRLDLATGAVSTLPIAVDLREPRGLALDSQRGQLYVVDGDGPVVWRIDRASGQGEILAGAPGMHAIQDSPDGSQARFYDPWGIAFDGASTLYVTDGDRVRKVDVGSRAVSSLGMSGVLLLGSAGIAFHNGELYVADGVPCRVVRIDAATGVATEVGSLLEVCSLQETPGPTRLRSGVTGLAIDDTTLYATNYGVLAIDIPSGIATRLVGGAGSQHGSDLAAGFARPAGVVVRGGEVLVADSGNHLIRRVDRSTAEVTTIAGTAPDSGAARGLRPALTQGLTDMVSDGHGHLYTLAENRVLVIDVASGDARVLAGGSVGAPGELASPMGIAFDGRDTLYVTDSSARQIRTVSTSSGDVRTLTTSGPLVSPTSITTDGTTLYIADVSALRKASLTSAVIETLASGIEPRYVLSVGPALYVADNRGVIEIVDSRSGAVEVLAGQPGSHTAVDGFGTAARFDQPAGLALDPGGALFVADAGSATVRKVDLATREVTTVVGQPGQAGTLLGELPGRLNQPAALAWLWQGTIAIADQAEGAILIARLP